MKHWYLYIVFCCAFAMAACTIENLETDNIARETLDTHNYVLAVEEASNADIKATENLMKLSEMMGIIIVDHVIIGKNEYFSIIEHKKYKL